MNVIHKSSLDYVLESDSSLELMRQNSTAHSDLHVGQNLSPDKFSSTKKYALNMLICATWDFT